LYAVDINFEWSNIHSNGLPEEMYINKYCPEIVNGVNIGPFKVDVNSIQR
jgi:hypothetical protein